VPQRKSSSLSPCASSLGAGASRSRRASCRSLLGFLALAGCGTDDAPPTDQWLTQSDTTVSGAVRLVHTPPADGVLPRWIIEPEVRIGTTVRTEPDSLGVIRLPDAFELVKGVAPLPDGRVVVLEAQAQELRIFNSDGAHVATFGARGEGPGEFNDANGLLVGTDGRIRVNDPRNARISLFDPDQGFVGQTGLDVLSFAFIWEAAIDSIDRVHETTVAVRDGEVRGAIRVYDPDGDWIDTVDLGTAPPASDAAATASFEWEGPAYRQSVPVPFRLSGFRQIDPRGTIWQNDPGGNNYRIVRTSFPGDTLLIIESPRSPEPVSPSEREAVMAELRERSGGQELDWSRIPEEKPTVEGGFLDDRNRLWVRVGPGVAGLSVAEGSALDASAAPAGTIPDGTTWEIFGDDGMYQGTAVTALKLPVYLNPVVVGDQLYAVDSTDPQLLQVVRARIRELAPPTPTADP